MKENSGLMTGVCIYCGQAQSVMVPPGAEQAYADELATEKCYCISSQRARLEKKTIESVNQLFGICSEGIFKPVEEEELSLIIDLVKSLVNEVISNVSISLTSGGKCSMKYKDITCIEVKREEKHTAKRSN